MALYVTDTHPLVWYASGRHARLSRKALGIFDDAVREQALIYVPAVVIWEVCLLQKHGRIALRESFERWASALLTRGGFDIAPLDVPVIAETIYLNFTDDLFDTAIVATARVKNLPLITKDRQITEARIIEVVW